MGGSEGVDKRMRQIQFAIKAYGSVSDVGATSNEEGE